MYALLAVLNALLGLDAERHEAFFATWFVVTLSVAFVASRSICSELVLMGAPGRRSIAGKVRRCVLWIPVSERTLNMEKFETVTVASRDDQRPGTGMIGAFGCVLQLVSVAVGGFGAWIVIASEEKVSAMLSFAALLVISIPLAGVGAMLSRETDYTRDSNRVTVWFRGRKCKPLLVFRGRKTERTNELVTTLREVTGLE
jgi:hypothetical protein